MHILPLLVKETGFIIDLLLNTPGGGADKKSPGSLVMEIKTIVMLEGGECYSVSAGFKMVFWDSGEQVWCVARVTGYKQRR